MNTFVAELVTMDKNDRLFEQASAALDAYLETHGLRKTRERYELLRVVCGMPGIFTMDQLQAWMEGHSQMRLSRSTVYGGMDLLVDAGIMMKHAHFRPVHFELCVSGRPHICLVCEVCGSVQPLADVRAETAIADIRSRRMSIRQRLLYLTGVCRKCEATQRRESRGDQKKNGTTKTTRIKEQQLG